MTPPSPRPSCSGRPRTATRERSSRSSGKDICTRIGCSGPRRSWLPSVPSSRKPMIRTKRTATRRQRNGEDFGNRSGHDQLVHGRDRGGRASRDRERGGRSNDAVRGGDEPEERRALRRDDREASGRDELGEHHLLGQAVHGPPVRRGQRAARPQARPVQGRKAHQRRRIRRNGRQDLRPAGDVRDDPAEAQAGRRGQAGRDHNAGRHHRARLLQRQPAERHEGRGTHRRPRGAAHHQRADGGFPRLRTRQERRRDHRRVRPRRRHLRHHDPPDRRGRLRGQVDERRHSPRRRRLRPAHHGLDRRGVQARSGHRPRKRPHGPPASP